MNSDRRTPEAKKWAADYLPPETCGSIDTVQNNLEHLRDANSQLRHVAQVALARANALALQLKAAREALEEIVGLTLIENSMHNMLTEIYAVGRNTLLTITPTGDEDVS